ncbi:MAG: hypothetical protein PHH26_04865 [Candidatus Thermoplasmatota archaeon]|nr:hypothetical protein [Candidatus Thermoplasmatota archaeon]
MKNPMMFAVCLLFLGSMFALPDAIAADESPFNEWVEARLDITFTDTLTGCHVNGTFDVRKESYNGIVCSADDLRSIYSAAANPSDKQAMVNALNSFIDEQSGSMVDFFSGDAAITPHDATCGVSTLSSDVAGSDAYNPVRFYKDYDISFRPSFFKMSNESQMEAVRAFLVMGAKVAVNGVKLSSNNGWSTTFKYILPQGFSFESASASYGSPVIVDSGRSVSQTIDNVKGGKGQCVLDMNVSYDDAPVLSEDVQILIEADATGLPQMEISALINIGAVSVPATASIPETVKMDYATADGIRMAYKYGWLTKADLDSETLPKISSMENALSEAFGANVSLSSSWSNLSGYTAEIMGKDPPASCAVYTDKPIDPGMNFSHNAVLGFLNAGATIRQNISIGEVGYDYNAKLILPENIEFKPDGSVSGSNPYVWTQAKPSVSGAIFSRIAPSYENALINATIDMKTLKAEILKIISGNLQAASEVEISVEVRRVNVPSDLEMPGKISMKYVNSDALRLALNEELISSDYFSNITEKMLGKMEGALSGMAGGALSLELDKAALDASLAIPVDISGMNDENPIVFKVKTFELSLGAKKSGAQAALVNLPKFSFSFPSMEYGDVIYRIIMPPGIEVVSAEGATSGKTQGGRQYVEASAMSGKSANIGIVLGVGIGFILGVAWPFIVGIVAVCAVVIAVVIIRKRQKK